MTRNKHAQRGYWLGHYVVAPLIVLTVISLFVAIIVQTWRLIVGG